MPAGAAVVVYDGKRGRVFRIKYRDAAGVQVMETLGRADAGWTKAKAERELRHRLSDVERKAYRRPRPITFADYADQWLADCQARRNWRPSTLKIFRVRLRRLKAHFGHEPLGAVRPRDVAAYIAATLGDYSPATVAGDVNVLFDVYKTARREELVEANPAEGAERPSIPRQRWRILEPAEVGAILRAFTDEQACAAFLTLVLTGIRRGELQGLRWRDIDLTNPDGARLWVRDSKTEDGVRSIALSPALAEALWQHRRVSPFQGDNERVFCNPKTGGVYRPEAFAEALRAALSAAGVEGYVRPFHDLRHTAITNDAASGASPIAVMAKAGHSSMATTKRYLHLAGTVFADEAAALERRLLGERV